MYVQMDRLDKFELEQMAEAAAREKTRRLKFPNQVGEILQLANSVLVSEEEAQEAMSQGSQP